LFRQRAEGTQPNFRGGCNIDGVEYEIVGWNRRSKRGKDYISLKVALPRAAAPMEPF
jgi:uncharacterized protein (DUF736 family)